MVSEDTAEDAITLGGTDINIATGDNPAIVGAHRTDTHATITGLNRSHRAGVRLERQPLRGQLRVSNFGTTVSVFAPGTATPTSTLTGLNYPEALAFDSSGNLYVANNADNDTVSVFAPHATTPTSTLTGLNGPSALAFDSSGNVYVANLDGDTVSVFAPGSTTRRPRRSPG